MLDLSTPASIVTSLEGLNYSIIFLLFLIEGPILSFIVAFAASLGFFNFFIILILAILGNFLGAVISFFIGKLGKKTTIERYVERTFNKQRSKKIKKYLNDHPGKTLTVIILTPVIPLPGLILAGLLDMNIKKFIWYSLLITITYTSFLVFLGYYSGTAFIMISKYIKYGTYIGSALIIAIIIVLWFLSKKIPTKIERI
jgi:membrane-associated protein